jgi:hypothetical protein
LWNGKLGQGRAQGRGFLNCEGSFVELRGYWIILELGFNVRVDRERVEVFVLHGKDAADSITGSVEIARERFDARQFDLRFGSDSARKRALQSLARFLKLASLQPLAAE